ncbi:hypothetical protein ACFYZ4_11295 [Streptomyces sp. NPDC001513]|uniref:hypothetical protein n=1 Tax=Streptomyces sp. NPDC001513 TaxID=3364580 RepID=UPI0036A57962
MLRETPRLILAEATMEEQAVCEAMLTTGATQEEIARRLGTTRKSVERRLHRVRRRARKLAAAGTIVVPVGQLGGDLVNGPLDLRLLVLLLLGVFAAYIAYMHPAAGGALLVGAGVVTLAYILMGTGGSGGPPTP